ncbi:hypothetical protein RN001_006548 [Aquatica leii]|uniref:Major facilitator superfamily (MFS) profile domain-containing protein n=1 Tax=Aquatica leii TaxID=1421715 RepID=A0AAN7SJW3_9COLE|nr:hypothetical protein RN001_006548 [Aquatica leii]
MPENTKQDLENLIPEPYSTYGCIENSDTNTTNKPVDLIEATIGGFGKWQCRLSILVSILKIPISWIQLSIVFMAPPTEFWCAPPQNYKKMAIKKWIELVSTNTKENFCVMRDISQKNSNLTTICLWGYDYNRTNIRSSIITEWDLVCNKKILVDITQTVLMFGVLIGIIIFGPAADRYGRRKILMISIILQTICGALSTISPWYSLFLVFRFLLAVVASGVMVTSFVMCVEIVAGTWRTTVPILHQIPFGLGNTLMATIAYFVRDWRNLQLILFGISALYIVYYWLIPESPRWLMAVDRREEAIKILEKAAVVNGIDKELIRKRCDRLNFINDDSFQNKVGLTSVFQTSELRRRSIFLCIKWFFNGIVFYGFYQYAGHLNENMYLTVGFIGLISIPGGVIGALIVMKCGRRISIAAANYLTAACLFSIIVIPKGVYYQDWPIVLISGCGIFGLTISSPALHLFTGELYPTVLRNVALGLNIMLTKLGAMAAPLIIGLGDTYTYLPLLVFGVLSVLEAVLVHPLPETLNAFLPETVSDVENENSRLITQ